MVNFGNVFCIVSCVKNLRLYQHQNIQTLITFIRRKLPRIIDMSGIPELLAYNKNEVSKAEMKYVVQCLKTMTANKTLCLKKGYIDFVLPEPASIRRLNEKMKYKQENVLLLSSNDDEVTGNSDSNIITGSELLDSPNSEECEGKHKNSENTQRYERKQSSQVRDEENLESENTVKKKCKRKAESLDECGAEKKLKNEKRQTEGITKRDNVVKKENEESEEMQNEGWICKKCRIITQFHGFTKTSGYVDHICNFVKISSLSQPQHTQNKYSDLRKSAVTMVTCPDKVQSDHQSLFPPLSMFVALDCEFVGVGYRGNKNALGRCSIVDHTGALIYNSYCKPEETVTDHRFRFSGITPMILRERGRPFSVVQQEVKNMIKDKIVVGHAVFNDFRVLDIHHPRELIRDTARCRLLTQRSGTSAGLKVLSQALLDRTIQVGRKGHCSVQDAKASLDLYMLVREEWETILSKRKRMIDQTDAMEVDKSFLDDEFWPDFEESKKNVEHSNTSDNSDK